MGICCNKSPRLRNFAGHTAEVKEVAFARGGRLVASAGGDDKTARVWDLESGATLHTLEGHTGGVRAVTCFDRGGGWVIVTASDDKTARVWDLESGAARRTLQHPGWV